MSGIVLKGPPQLLDARRQRIICDGRVSPHDGEEIFLGHRFSRARYQYLQYGRGPRCQTDFLVAGPQTAGLQVEMMPAKADSSAHLRLT
jgi:hypothetical protein